MAFTLEPDNHDSFIDKNVQAFSCPCAVFEVHVYVSAQVFIRYPCTAKTSEPSNPPMIHDALALETERVCGMVLST